MNRKLRLRIAIVCGDFDGELARSGVGDHTLCERVSKTAKRKGHIPVPLTAGRGLLPLLLVSACDAVIRITANPATDEERLFFASLEVLGIPSTSQNLATVIVSSDIVARAELLHQSSKVFIVPIEGAPPPGLAFPATVSVRGRNFHRAVASRRAASLRSARNFLKDHGVDHGVAVPIERGRRFRVVMLPAEPYFPFREMGNGTGPVADFGAVEMAVQETVRQAAADLGMVGPALFEVVETEEGIVVCDVDPEPSMSPDSPFIDTIHLSGEDEKWLSEALVNLAVGRFTSGRQPPVLA